jgi:hypothetical protein
MAPKLDTVVALGIDDLTLFSCGNLKLLRGDSLTAYVQLAGKVAPLIQQADKAENSIKLNGIILAIGFVGCAMGVSGLADLHWLDMTSAIFGIVATVGAGVLLGRDSWELLKLRLSVKALTIPAAEYKAFTLRCDSARLRKGCP